MITKEKLKTHIDSFPEEMSIDELIERLLFVEKLENRIAESENNDTINEEELEKEIQKWSR